MWTSKPIPESCPKCGRQVMLTLTMAADPDTMRQHGVSVSVDARIRPKAYCDGDPRGFPPERSCGWYVLGTVDQDGYAVFAPW
jgi:hypothetical protein